MSPEEKVKFIVDDMLGRLAKWLRILGYDTSHYPSISDDDLIEKALAEKRTVLTRDSRLAERKVIRDLLLVKSENPKEQLKQVIKEKRLNSFAYLFSRCLVCNEPVFPLKKEVTRDKVPDYVYQTQDSFQQCPNCRRIYWSGSHLQNVRENLEKMK